MNSFTLYYCYAREDNTLRAELEKHLVPLKLQGQITSWHQGEVLAGGEWQQENSHYLNTADVILLLASSDLFKSNNVSKEVLTQALARHKREDTLLIPILLRPVDLEGSPISDLKVLPSNGVPITKWRNRDEAFLDIVKGIRQAINTLLVKRVQLSPTSHMDEMGKPSDRQDGLYRTIQSVFLFNAPLTDVNEFYGRLRECTTLLDRTYKGLATSVVGPRRMGKTWLIQYLKLIAPTQFGSRFRIAYIDATSPHCATVVGFVSSTLEELKVHYDQKAEKALDLASLERAVKTLKGQDCTPVLCIDEFEGLTNEDTFDLRFFSGLRAIAQIGLSLVVVSKRSLLDLVSSALKTSPFFNIFEKLIVKPFSTKEAEMFVNVKCQLAGFDAQERDRLLAYAMVGESSWPPARLQLVGTLLLEEKTLAQLQDPDYYRPADAAYWKDFEKRLEEKYQEIGQ